jgi:VanZ family protein
VYAFVAILMFAAADELHQIIIPSRSASTGDWFADAAGALCGLAAAMFLISRRKVSP